MRFTHLGMTALVAQALLACTSTHGLVSIGDDAKALVSASDVVGSKAACKEGAHPNVCCRGTECFVWLDDPFRPCEPGFETQSDGARCCTNADPSSCTRVPTDEPRPLCAVAPIQVFGDAAAEGYAVTTFRKARPADPTMPEVHLIGIYEARSDHAPGVDLRGEVKVRVERLGRQILVLSSYEPVNFIVAPGDGAFVEQVILRGHGQHTVVAPLGARIVDQSGPANADEKVCFASGKEGCPALEASLAAAAMPVTSFAGSYRAEEFLIHRDAPDCGTGRSGWESYPFATDRALSACAGGKRLVRFAPRYGKFVGAELCSPSEYKLFLGETREGIFHEIGDYAGHGQDHCELVDPGFSIPNEDDVTSGGCKTCAARMQPDWTRPGAVPVYARSRFGEPFVLETWPEHNLYTSLAYRCGVDIAE